MTTWQRNGALLVAGFTAWALSVFVEFGLPALLGYVDLAISELLGWLFLSALFGLPLALLISFSLGGWQLDLCVRLSNTAWTDAVKAGAKVGMIIGAVSLGFTVAAGLVSQPDGLLRSMEWLRQGLEFFATTLIGALSGFASWLTMALQLRPSALEE